MPPALLSAVTGLDVAGLAERESLFRAQPVIPMAVTTEIQTIKRLPIAIAWAHSLYMIGPTELMH